MSSLHTRDVPELEDKLIDTSLSIRFSIVMILYLVATAGFFFHWRTIQIIFLAGGIASSVLSLVWVIRLRREAE